MKSRFKTRKVAGWFITVCALGVILQVYGMQDSDSGTDLVGLRQASAVVVENERRVAAFSTTEYEPVSVPRTSDRFPDVDLMNQHGEAVRFYSDLVQDQCVCIVYFYTRCNGSCPTTTQVVRRLRKDLSEEFDASELRFISLTLEPEVDTPEELREYMDRYQIEESDSMPEWTYATGNYDEVEALRRSLGIYDLDPVIDADKTEHAAILTFGNDRLDRWAALPVAMDYEQLKKAMVRIMGNNPRQRYATVAKYNETLLPE